MDYSSNNYILRYDSWINETTFLYRNAHQGCVPDTTQWVLLIQRLRDMYANFNGRSKHSGVGIFNDENVKSV
jgi:hypothetical protein